MYSSNLNTNMNIIKYIFVLDIFCQQLGKIYVSWRVSVNPLGAELGNVHLKKLKFVLDRNCQHFAIYNSVEMIHQRVSVRPLGVGFRNVHFFIFIHIGYKLPTFGEYMSVEFIYWYWIYPANYWRIYVSWRVSAPGPNCPGPNCSP